jgi:IS30 family transposase
MREIHHLTLEDRKVIQAAIEEGKTKAEMGRMLGKDPCGINREIKRHREFKGRNTYGRPVLCENRRACRGKCAKKCANFKEPTCKRRDSTPGACNGCEKRAKCPLDKYFYNAARADAAYRTVLVDCREGINLNADERDLIGTAIAPLLKQGQSVYQVLSAHPEIPFSERTMYRYIETGVFKGVGVDNFSLKEQVNRKQFKGKYKKRKEPANYNGRKYSDYLLFIGEHPELQAVEMDTVYNNPSGPYLQTFMFPDLGFMIGRIHGERTNECMSSAVDHYQNRLGLDLFRRLFGLVLTDRGSEFEMWKLFEYDKQGIFRLNIFYCDPMQSAQKPHVENNHNYVRDIIPNGKQLSGLSQEDVDLMFSHINSTPRKALRGKTPFEVFSFYHGAEMAGLLDCREIARDNVILKPSLIFNR